VYIKRVELTHFKSFGGTTQVPLMGGFTVISGPNGSGKSNILDALLFCLGLAGSKGMRAERLPDLVNQNQTSRGRATVEASVSVTFDLSDELEQLALDSSPNGVLPHESGFTDEQRGLTDERLENQSSATHRNEITPSHSKRFDGGLMKEWIVTRKLRVTQQGSYTSTYFMNGESCTLTDLHQQLERLRIYPEGYNVVLQGDVTGIISMHPRERRQIIDELAGVASFDRKIIQAKEKLDAVKEREDRCRIVERELLSQRDHLAQDRLKAEKYQKLRIQLQEKIQWEVVLGWRDLQFQVDRFIGQIETGDRTLAEVMAQIDGANHAIHSATRELEELNGRVKSMGEDELLALQSTLATKEAEQRQLQRLHQELEVTRQDTNRQIAQLHHDLQEQLQTLTLLTQERDQVETVVIHQSRMLRDHTGQELEHQRQHAAAIASASEAWVQQQSDLHHQIDTLLHTLDPQRQEQSRLKERSLQLERQIEQQSSALDVIQQEVEHIQQEQTQFRSELSTIQQQNQSLQQTLRELEQQLELQRQTHTRLLTEQRDKQRQLDKLEAQVQVLREAQGTHAAQVLIQAKLPGVLGLVAQLGRVETRFQLALEIAAGGRLAHLVVEDDGVAAAGIELLKKKRAGRMTFLPLNTIKPVTFTPIPVWQRPDGFVEYAVNLIDCDRRYQVIFAYVFGSTVVFNDLNSARGWLGQSRIVTLGGELLETSGAMTGGSLGSRSGLQFGSTGSQESTEVIALKQRLEEINRVLERCTREVDHQSTQFQEQKTMVTAAGHHERERQLQLDQLQRNLERLLAQYRKDQQRLEQHQTEQRMAQSRLVELEHLIPDQETQLQRWRQSLHDLEQSQTHQEWQAIQTQIRQQEALLRQQEVDLRTAERRSQDLETQRQRLQERIQQLQQRQQSLRQQQNSQLGQQANWLTQITNLDQQITADRLILSQLEATLGGVKQQRDRVERQLREQLQLQQQYQWQQQKLQETLEKQRQDLTSLQHQLMECRTTLPDPIPTVPNELSLVQLQQEIRTLQRRIEAMEPVNMLALTEYDRTQARLEELTQKLGTLAEERTELLLRIENFTTLRQKAFREAFDVVNQNFQSIFAELSDGDGYLQLEDSQDPFNGGLNLVAHPKGKPVRRLASMSGGEKSLTALSFIFALQRYRPSPFYAFDEVDMFLDGANVERLAKMIRQQSQQAQFIVVSLRRPMIESAERTIGVTQARGAYTQVIGIKLTGHTASM